MHRYFLSTVFCYGTICIIQSQIILAASSHDNKNPTKSDSLSGKIEKKKNPSQSLILVPPPPPGQPSFLDWSGAGTMPESFNLLNAEELKQKLVHLQKQIEDSKLSIEENNKQVIDAQDKAQRFISLYSEGVVSRKELETAKKNILEQQKSLQDEKNKLEDLKAQESAILRRLNNLNKNKSHPNKRKSKREKS